MNQDVKISVVIPLHNKGKYVGDTLETIKKQVCHADELIVVNDHSTDNSLEVVVGALSDYKWSYRILNSPRYGVSAARNFGIENSLYDYICFLDADDWWDYDYIQEMKNLILLYPDKAIYGLNFRFANAYAPPRIDSNIRSERQQCRVISNYWNDYIVYTASTVCINKKVLHELGGFDERIKTGQDIDLWYRVLLKYDGAFNEKQLAYYRQDVLGQVSQQNHPIEDNYIFYCDKFNADRGKNADFRKFIDNDIAARLVHYQECAKFFFCREYRRKVLNIRKQIDSTSLSPKSRIRLYFPLLYMVYDKIVHHKNSIS